MGFDELAMLAILQLPTPSASVLPPEIEIAAGSPITIEYAATGGVGTPTSIPFEVDLPTLPTAQLPILEPIVELVAAAEAHIRAMAFLPGDPAADELVQRLRSSRSAEGKRSLTRRR